MLASRGGVSSLRSVCFSACCAEIERFVSLIQGLLEGGGILRGGSGCLVCICMIVGVGSCAVPASCGLVLA